ncbi:MAG: hypothetical protein JHC26_12650 [Thermofilum sp.]|jgi:hypothetical protein|uniref:hypothetical protein n=1 Tax=Thermofilum sp. TaxID=1961369 RepID=UPI00258907C1|nr:hypothetical protein [Thermofilum sp.]MCI4409935.1 hypothetical protein [Thermofilum sp.]
MPIPTRDRDVILDVPKFLLKRMVKVDPSPVSGREGEGIYYIGKFSDTWADYDLRGKDFYYAHAKVILSPRSVNDLNSKVMSAFGDPPFASFSSALCAIFFTAFCGPSGSTTWQNCLDPSFESSGTGCYPSGTVGAYDYSKCYNTYAAPSMFIFSGAPSSESDMTYLTAYSKPCPVASTAPTLSGKTQTSGNVLVRAVGCDDSSNKVRYVRYTSEDKGSASYTIAYIGMGSITGTSSIYTALRYGLSASVTKGATDYYYYIYTIGFQYQ